MNAKLHKILIRVSKICLYGFIAQLSVYTFAFGVGAHSQSVNEIEVSLNVESSTTLQELIISIEEVTDFSFSFLDKEIEPSLYTIKTKVRNKSLGQVLSDVSRQTNLSFRRVNDRIYVRKRTRGSKAVTEVIDMDEIRVQGTVTDENNQALPGATIIEKGTSNGTVTDINGQFTMTVADESSTLIVTFVGFQSQEIVVGGRSRIDITMMPDVEALQEVVVVGYGTVEKEDVTGAITSVSGDDLNVTKENSALSALAGKAAGVDISFSDASPGGTTDVRIRGRSSLNFSNAPLVVIDGIPLSAINTSATGDGLDLNDINPNDIASMEVLKDASSTAIYGARGANGVILITTKRGQAGKAKVTYDAYYGISQPEEQFDMTNSDEYVALRLESLRAASEQNDGLDVGTVPVLSVSDLQQPLRAEAYAAGVDTDFQDILQGSGLQQNHQIGVSGGNENTRYNISLGYFDQEGIVKGADYNRYTLRTNLDLQAHERVKLGLSQQLSFSERNVVSTPMIEFMLRSTPLTTPYNEDGTPTTDPLADGLIWNPINDIDHLIDETKRLRYFANIFATVDILEGLTYTLNIGPDITFSRRNRFYGTLSTVSRGGLNRALKDQQTVSSITIENVLNYSKSLDNNHTINATLLGSVQEIQDERFGSEVRDIPSETQTFNNLGNAAEILGTSSSLTPESWVSYMARVNYDIAGKYLFTLTGRMDGSSKLAEGNKYGFFPSLAFGWRVIDEAFMVNSSLFSELKLRASYGSVGRNPIQPFASQGGIRRTEYSFSDQAAFGFRPFEIANPDLKWERTTTLDVGVDFGMANNRVSGSLDFYIGNTTDLLLERTIPITSGYSSVLQNVGETRNTGLELILSTVNIDNGSLKWYTDFNFSTNRSEIVSLFDSENDDIGNRWFIGEPLAVYFDREFAGIWQLNEADQAESFDRRPGDIRLADLNNDGVLNDDDRKIVGQLDPKWTAGFTSRLEYMGLDFTVAVYTRQGHTAESNFLGTHNTLFGRYSNAKVNYWTPENGSNEFPRPNANQERPLDSNVLEYIDASFWRVRNITLGYNFSESVISSIGLSGLRVYATAQNPILITATDIAGVDPDIAGANNILPSPRTYLFGLNVSF